MIGWIILNYYLTDNNQNFTYAVPSMTKTIGLQLVMFTLEVTLFGISFKAFILWAKQIWSIIQL